MYRLATILALLTTANAFTVPSFNRQGLFSARPVAGPTSSARFLLLTEEETEAIMSKATDCAEGECSIDDVNELIVELKDQQKLLEDRLSTVVSMVDKLKHLNELEERKVDEVRQYVRDFLRVFTNDKPFVTPSGFSGDIGDGPTTAYDALPPKPYKK
mmetsp:Transcript_11857/g.14792  ORF Transcript_11857/g.14792 Transcript_11857/m.14792 type:complete len:158 (-) Transcript_11857:297-770(-)